MSGFPVQDTRAPGYVLQPRAIPALTIDQVLQTWVTGITNLPGDMVRPRWQPAPPPMPDQGIDWVAIGYLSTTSDANAWFGHDPNDPTGLGTSTLQYHTAIDALASFYGTNCDVYANALNSGAFVGQNRDLLAQNGMMLVDVAPMRMVPELINQIWVRRADVPITLRQQITATFPIRTLLSAPVSTHNG